MDSPRKIGPLRYCHFPGTFWVAWGKRRLFRIKDVRKAEHILFSDRYVAWHIGPFAFSILRWPKQLPSATVANQRAERLMSWHSDSA